MDMQQVLQQVKNDPQMVQRVMQSPDGQKLMQLLTSADGGSTLGQAATAASSGNTAQMVAMLKKITQSLAGRTAVFELLPMSCAEIRKTATGTPLDDLLFSGFYPAICSGRNMPKFLYPAYVKTYLDKGTRFAANQGYDAVSYIYPVPSASARYSKPRNWPTKSVSVPTR